MSGGVPVTNAGVVVVVGLGPTGLAVALMLSSWGVHVVAVDPNVSPCPEPRAASMDDLAQRLLARECPAVSAHVQGLATQLVTSAGASLYNLAPTPGVHGCCEVGFFFQPDVEAELRSTLNARPTVDTRYGWCAEAVREDRDSVRVDLVGPDAGRCTVVAAFVLGCDGAASVVRRAAALQLAGTTLDAAGSWLVCDVKLPHGSVRDALGALESARHSTLMQSFRFVCDPARPGLDLPLPNGHARFEWLLDSPDHPTPPDAVLRQWLRARGVSEAVACGVEFVRRARYVFHARQATPHWHSHSRRLIVAGDAAHLTPPMRGQGLSSGIADAANVAWKLALVLRGVAPLVIVDSYEAERRHRVVANTHVAVWLSRLIASRSRFFCMIRDVIMPWVLALMRPQRDVFIASTTLLTPVRGPACDLPALVGSLLPSFCHAVDRGSFWFLLRGAPPAAAPRLSWLRVAGHCALPDGALAVVVRPDLVVMAAWRSLVPAMADVERQMEQCLQQPLVLPSRWATVYGALFAALRVVSPELVIGAVASALVAAFAWLLAVAAL